MVFATLGRLPTCPCIEQLVPLDGLQVCRERCTEGCHPPLQKQVRQVLGLHLSGRRKEGLSGIFWKTCWQSPHLVCDCGTWLHTLLYLPILPDSVWQGRFEVFPRALLNSRRSSSSCCATFRASCTDDWLTYIVQHLHAVPAMPEMLTIFRVCLPTFMF